MNPYYANPTYPTMNPNLVNPMYFPTYPVYPIPNPTYYPDLNILEPMIPVFNGNGKEIDCFIYNAESALKMCNPVLKPFLFQFIKSKIEGPAFDVIKFRNLNTWEELKKCLLNKYKKPKPLFEYKYELAKIKQEENEEVEAFVEKMQNLLDGIKEAVSDFFGPTPEEFPLLMRPYEKLALSSFIKGLKPELSILVRTQHPPDFQSAVAIAIQEDQFNQNFLFHLPRNCQPCAETNPVVKVSPPNNQIDQIPVPNNPINFSSTLTNQINMISSQVIPSTNTPTQFNNSNNIPQLPRSSINQISSQFEIQTQTQNPEFDPKFNSNENANSRINSSPITKMSPMSNSNPNSSSNSESTLEENPISCFDNSKKFYTKENSDIHENSLESQNPNPNPNPNPIVNTKNESPEENFKEKVDLKSKHIFQLQEFSNFQSNSHSKENTAFKVNPSSYDNSENNPEVSQIQIIPKSKKSENISGEFEENSKSEELIQNSKSGRFIQSENQIQNPNNQIPALTQNKILKSFRNSFLTSKTQASANAKFISQNSKLMKNSNLKSMLNRKFYDKRSTHHKLTKQPNNPTFEDSKKSQLVTLTQRDCKQTPQIPENKGRLTISITVVTAKTAIIMKSIVKNKNDDTMVWDPGKIIKHVFLLNFLCRIAYFC